MQIFTGRATERDVPSSAAINVRTHNVKTTSMPFLPRANFSSAWVSSLVVEVCRLRVSVLGGGSAFPEAELEGSEAILL